MKADTGVSYKQIPVNDTFPFERVLEEYHMHQILHLQDMFAFWDWEIHSTSVLVHSHVHNRPFPSTQNIEEAKTK